MNCLCEHPLQHGRENGRMGVVMSFQAFAPVASIVLLTGLVFAASSILSKERRLKIKKLVKSSLLIMSSSNASFDLEVEVMSNVSEQKDTSDDDEPEEVYAKEPKQTRIG